MKEESNRKKLLNLYPDNNEIKFIDALSHYIQNYRPGFKRTKNENTFVLSPSGSDIFPLDIIDSMPTLGIPNELFDLLMKTPMFNLNVIKDAPGIFMMLAVGTGANVKPLALRIYKRRVQSSAVGRYERIRLCRIDKDGTVFGFDSKNCIVMPILEIPTVDW